MSDELGQRPYREAALVVGATIEEVREDLPEASDVFAGERGTIVLDSSGIGFDARPDVTIYEVIHYLDTGEVQVFVRHGEDGAQFKVPGGGPSFGIPQLHDVEGETDPRKIIRKLGIPEQFMFP
jgi:hypothetical protein